MTKGEQLDQPAEIGDNETSVMTMSAQDMFSIVYDPDTCLPTERFMSDKEGGVFKYFYPNDVTYANPNLEKTFFSVIQIEDLIVGVAKLEEDPENSRNLWASFLAIDPAYQDRGYSKELMKEVARFAQSRSYDFIQLSYYSDMGKERLEPHILKHAGQLTCKLIAS